MGTGWKYTGAKVTDQGEDEDAGNCVDGGIEEEQKRINLWHGLRDEKEQKKNDGFAEQICKRADPELCGIAFAQYINEVCKRYELNAQHGCNGQSRVTC